MAPTMKTQMVSIPLEEYKELLLRDHPSDCEKVILGRIISILPSYLEYADNEYYSGYIVDYLKSTKSSEFLCELVKCIKYTDFELYMAIWNKVMTGEREKNSMEELIEQMRRAKEIRSENA